MFVGRIEKEKNMLIIALSGVFMRQKNDENKVKKRKKFIFMQKLQIAKTTHEFRNKRLRIADFFRKLRKKRLQILTNLQSLIPQSFLPH